MTTNSDFSSHHVTHQQILRGMALGRQARARAFGSALKTVFGFLVGRKVKQIEGHRSAARHAV